MVVGIRVVAVAQGSVAEEEKEGLELELELVGPGGWIDP